MTAASSRVKFAAFWALLLVAKVWLAATLQPFGDEAFYALESRRLAWAYSDLPGLTAWLIRLGTELGGQNVLAMRAPFLLLGALLPLLVVRIARREFGDDAGWQAGLLALLLPLSGLMGVLALPDVPMLVAALLCLDAFAALLRGVRVATLLQLAFALALGALAHYRFALVIIAGAVGLACVPQGRALLRRPGLWLALAGGALGWVPLLAWNLSHGGAGLEFQFVDRHPWQPHGDGIGWLPVQFLVVTPGLFVLLLAVLATAWRRRRDDAAIWPLLLGVGGTATLGYFVLGFFADSERVSFHWPLAGWLALCCAAPVVLMRWPRRARRAVHVLAAVGLVAIFGWLATMASTPGRERLAATPLYADNFAGWSEVAAAVRDELATMPDGAVPVADNFMVGAQLAFARDAGDIAVLDHPLNRKHGRHVQLSDWGLLSAGRSDWRGPVLLVVEDTARPLKERLAGYRTLCERVGALPSPRVLNVDHGRKRFLLFRLPQAHAGASAASDAACITPALAWIDAPASGATLAADGVVAGWALKPGAGIARVDVTLDGRIVASTQDLVPRADVLAFWGVDAEDATASRVAFSVPLDLPAQPPGGAWLGLVLHGHDGSVEAWPEQRVRIAPQGSR